MDLYLPIYLRVPDRVQSDPEALAEWQAAAIVRVAEAVAEDGGEMQYDDPVRFNAVH